MSQIQIKIEAFGAVEQYLPKNLQVQCQINSTVADVLYQVGQQYPNASAMIERCACAIGEDIITRHTQLYMATCLVLLSPVAGG